MAQVAICPLCDFEFDPSATAAVGEFTNCPSCGAPIKLRDDAQAVNERDLQEGAQDLETSAEDELQIAQRRIDKWFNSAKTVPEITTQRESPLEGELSNDIEPVKSSSDLGQTIDLSANDDSRDVSEHEHELEFNSRAADADDKPTWDDSERMERLLADIEVQPIDDYLPVAQASHVADDDTATVEYSADEYQRLGLDRPEHGNERMISDDEQESRDDEIVIAASPRPRRRRSVVRSLVGLAVAGMFGLAGGYLILLWMMGPDGDFLQVARHLPNAVLPQSLRGSSQQLAQSAPSRAEESNETREPATLPVAADAGTLPEPAGLTPSFVTPQQPAEKQASFEAPAAAPSSTPRVVGDRYPDPPTERQESNYLVSGRNRSDDMFKVPNSFAESTRPKIIGAPTYSAGQLADALELAREAQPSLIAGDLNDVAVQKTKGLSYSKLCELADVATFVETSSPGSSSENEHTRESELLFKETLADPRVRAEVARIAPIWINSVHRKHGGIFFAGTMVSGTPHGSMTECQVDLGGGSPLTILAPAPVVDRLVSSNPVAVVGSLINKPGERIEGYTGNAAQVIWASSVISLDN